MAGPFELELRAFAEKAGDRSDVAVREVVLEIASRLIYRSPVDTGRFRGNWFYSLDGPDAQTVGATVADAAAIYQGASSSTYPTTVNNMAQMPRSASGHIHYLQNNLPYAWALERGHSGQAPNGMVGLTIQDFAAITDKAVLKARST